LIGATAMAAKRHLPESGSLYGRDFFAWTQQQAALLRRAAMREPTSDLDLENLAEEIESLGRRDRRALISQITRVTEHLLKLQHSRLAESRPGWESSVDVHRAKARRILADSPGLKAELEAILTESYADGRRFAARSLRNEVDPETLPKVCPYSLDQIFDVDWWPPRD
jgi:Domain of unknown function DUF29